MHINCRFFDWQTSLDKSNSAMLQRKTSTKIYLKVGSRNSTVCSLWLYSVLKVAQAREVHFKRLRETKSKDSEEHWKSLGPNHINSAVLRKYFRLAFNAYTPYVTNSLVWKCAGLTEMLCQLTITSYMWYSVQGGAEGFRMETWLEKLSDDRLIMTGNSNLNNAPWNKWVFSSVIGFIVFIKKRPSTGLSWSFESPVALFPTPVANLHRHTGLGSGAVASPPLPQSQKFLKYFSTKHWWFRQKYSGENILKVSQDQACRLLSLKFAWVKVKRYKDPSILEKLYIVEIGIMEIPDVDIICIAHQQYNDKRIKANKADFFFVVTMRRAILNGFIMSCCKILLNFSHEEELISF